MNKFEKVVEQIELFIKKYYKNQMVKGGILFLSVLLLTYLLVSGLEYVGRFGSGIRLTLLVAFIGINLFLLGKFIIIPLMNINKLGKHLSIFDASDMIGGIFPDIGDKLKNTLQLSFQQENSHLNLDLIKASIEQRSTALSVIPFATGIDFSENKRHLKLFLPILFLFTAVAVINPNIFSEGTERVINFNEEYVAPAPFEFVLASASETKEGEDYLLEIKLEGTEIPSEVKIYSNVGTYNLQQKSKIEFEYKFSNLSKDVNFYCEANGYESQKFNIKLLRKPIMEEMTLSVVYPRHTGKKKELFDNTGDITIPEGSLVQWNIIASNLQELEASFNDTSIVFETSLSKSYIFQRKFFKSEDYVLTMSSDEIKNADSLFYNINIVPDAYPTIIVDEEIDSTNDLRRFVEGKITDDYGFRSLSVKFKVMSNDSNYVVSKPLKFNPQVTNQLFSFYVDLSLFDLGPGDRIEYYFTVSDNDEINGFKSATSAKKVFSVPTLDELDNKISESTDDLKDDMEEALNDSEELKKKIEELEREMVNKPNLDWKDKQKLESLLNMQKSLDTKIEQLKMDFEKNTNEQNNYLENSEEIQEKQEQLQELMDQLMDEEMMELFKELEELMNEMNKDQLVEKLDEMESKTESMEEELDRTLELLKNMELDMKLDNLEEQLRQLAKEQEELSELTEDKNFSSEELKSRQDSLNKKFDEIQKDMDEVLEKNDELESPRDIDFDEEMEKEIEESLEQSSDNLEDNKRKKSKENQGEASDKMKEMADDVSNMKMEMQAQQEGEDMDSLRYLLENIVSLSHQQENLMDEYHHTTTTDPYYLELNKKQIDINSSTEIVNDSLIALSKRVYQLSSFITDELGELNYSLDKSLTFSEQRNTNATKQHQQYAMTSFNDLALMLSEVLDQMQAQAKSKMQGEGSCNNPGGSGQGKSGKMSMQQIKDAMKDQINKMKGGKKPGGEDGKNKDGEGKGQGPGGTIPGLTNKEIAKMAAEQSLIRESLKQMREDLNKDGSGAGNELNDVIEELDQLENDLLNGVGGDFLKRQQDILTKLLDSEKALRERGYSDERKSKEGKNTDEGNLIEFTEYNKKKNAEIEFLRSLPIGLQVYYKNLVNEYFNSVNN